jgi:hypothetical protein
MRKSLLKLAAIAAASLSLQPAIAQTDMTGGPMQPPVTGEQWIKYCPQIDQVAGHGELSLQLLERAKWCATYATGFADAMLVFIRDCESLRVALPSDIADTVTRYLIAHPSDRRYPIPSAIAIAFGNTSMCVTKK